MPDATLGDKFVLMCDWRGRVVWGTATIERVRPGDLAWKYLVPESQERAKQAVARTITLGEKQVFEVHNDRHEHVRVWLWPLGTPEMAICVLGERIPSELARLTERELECLYCLAAGRTTREMAAKLDIGVTTVHTHLRNCREKLGLPGGEALIAYAARYCQPGHGRAKPK